MIFTAAASRALQSIILLIVLAGLAAHAPVQSPRQIIAHAIVEEDAEKKAAIVSSLNGRAEGVNKEFSNFKAIKPQLLPR